MRRRRARGWAIAAVIALLGLFVTADVVALQYFQTRGGAELARGLAAEHATVDLGSMPFLHEYVRGQRGEVEVRATGIAAGGLRVQTLTLHLSEVRFSPTSIFRLTRSRYATRTSIEADEPDLRIEISQSDLDAFLRARHRGVARVRILETGPAAPHRHPPRSRPDETGRTGDATR
jgi:hypothetical protein